MEAVPSYQSAGRAVKSLGAARVLAVLALATLTTASRPYEDARRGFRITLAEGWALSPLFGDTEGMVFRRDISSRRGEGLALLMVRSVPLPAGGLEAYMAGVERELGAQPGFRRLEDRTARIGGREAEVRVYRTLVSAESRLEKQIRAHFLAASGRAYLIHLEAPPRDLARIEPEVEAMLASFEVLGPRREGVSDPRPTRPSLAGRWVNDDGLVMVLGADESFALADVAGRFEVKGDTLTLVIPGQGRESFSFVLDPGAETLTLSSANLEAPMVYRRGGRSAEAPRKSGGDAPGDAPGTGPADPSAIAGTWETSSGKNTVRLTLRKDGGFRLGPHAGKWSASGGTLRLERSATDVISYRFHVNNGALVLEGGDLDGPVSFTRRPARRGASSPPVTGAD